MSLWGVQLVIGKLITDDAFRQHFASRGRESLAKLREQGIDLSDEEISAFLETDGRLWSAVGTLIDPRLRPGPAMEASRSMAHASAGSLTARESRVLRGIFEGLTNKQIATDIGVSE